MWTLWEWERCLELEGLPRHVGTLVRQKIGSQEFDDLRREPHHEVAGPQPLDLHFQLDADFDDPNLLIVLLQFSNAVQSCVCWKCQCVAGSFAMKLTAKTKPWQKSENLQLWLWRSWGKFNQGLNYGQCWMHLDAIHFSVENGTCWSNLDATCFRIFSAEDGSCYNKSQMFMVVKALRLQFTQKCQEIFSEFIIGYHGSCSMSVIHDFVSSDLLTWR